MVVVVVVAVVWGQYRSSYEHAVENNFVVPKYSSSSKPNLSVSTSSAVEMCYTDTWWRL